MSESVDRRYFKTEFFNTIGREAAIRIAENEGLQGVKDCRMAAQKEGQRRGRKLKFKLRYHIAEWCGAGSGITQWYQRSVFPRTFG